MTGFHIWRNKPVLGWIFYDFANSAFATIVLAVIFNQYFAGEIAGGEQGITLRLPLGGSDGWHLPGATVWNYLVAFSTALVAVSAPLLGAMADHSSRRKTFLAIYCLLGVLSTRLDLPRECWQAGLSGQVKNRFLEVNSRAFDLGRKLGENGCPGP